MAQQVLLIDGWAIPHLVKYEVAYNKLWAEDSGRDMAGENKATLIGIFPKIQVQVGTFTKDEMKLFLSKVNKAELTVSWYDAEIDTQRTGQSYYINDFSISMISTRSKKYKGFSFNLIPNKRR